MNDGMLTSVFLAQKAQYYVIFIQTQEEEASLKEHVSLIKVILMQLQLVFLQHNTYFSLGFFFYSAAQVVAFIAFNNQSDYAFIADGPLMETFISVAL